MAPLPEFDPNACQRENQRKKRQQQRERSAKLLMYLLDSPEVADNIDNVLTAFENNKNDFNHLPVCCQLLVKFTNKAIQTKKALQWYKVIEQLIIKIEKSEEVRLRISQKISVTFLYISKHRCLKAIRKNKDQEGEDCLYQAIKFSRNEEELIEIYLELAQYYENISEYKKMKTSLLKIENLCYGDSKVEENLARVWVLLGEYYFFQFNFHRSRKYLNQANSKLEELYEKSNFEWVPRVFSTCLHYIGRTYFEEYEFVKAAKFYMRAQKILEENRSDKLLLDDLLSTAFYHLRLGQVLDICQITSDAREHYHKSSEIFEEYQFSKSGLAQVNLALSNLIKYDDYIKKINGSSFLKEVKQIKNSAKNALESDYYRGYLLALVQLFWLYVRNLKFYLALKTVWKALASDEFSKSGGILLLYRYITKIILGIYYKIRFIIRKKFYPNQVLDKCPCSIHNTNYEN